MPDEDPMAPGWRAQYSGPSSDLGDVGSGGRLGVECYYLYRAGRNELPGVARTYSQLTTKVHRTDGAMQALFDVPGRGMEVTHMRLLELRDELHDVFRTTCLRMQQFGDALVTIAAVYVATDEAAVEAFNEQLDIAYQVGSSDPEALNWHPQPPFVPPPPPVGAPQPEQQHDDRGLVPQDPLAATAPAG